MKTDLQIIVDLRKTLGRDPTREEIGTERHRLYTEWHNEMVKADTTAQKIKQ